MNCRELQKDIETLENGYKKLEEKLTEATTTGKAGKGKDSIVEIQAEVAHKTDGLLNKYFKDFQEQFAKPLVKLGPQKKIEVLNKSDRIISIQPVSKDEFLVGVRYSYGLGGQTRVYKKGKAGNLRYVESIDNKKTGTITEIGENEWMIAGRDGAAIDFLVRNDDSYKFRNRIWCDGDQFDEFTPIQTIVPVSDDKWLVGGDSSLLTLRRNHISQDFETSVCILPEDISIKAILPLAHGKIIVGGSFGKLSILRETTLGRYIDICTLSNFGGHKGDYMGGINDIASISDHKWLVGGFDSDGKGIIRVAVEKPDSQLEYEREIGKFGSRVMCIKPLANNKYIIVEENGNFQTLKYYNLHLDTVDQLRENIDNIIDISDDD